MKLKEDHSLGKFIMPVHNICIEFKKSSSQTFHVKTLLHFLCIRRWIQVNGSHVVTTLKGLLQEEPSSLW